MYDDLVYETTLRSTLFIKEQSIETVCMTPDELIHFIETVCVTILFYITVCRTGLYDNRIIRQPCL